MGMFDTIRLDPPLKCPVCSTAVAEVQTHDFGNTLAVYRLGSVMTMSPVLTGIVKETYYCEACRKIDASRETVPIYIGVWHSVLVSVSFSLGEVERRLTAVDRLDLIAWLNESQRQANEWERRFHRLRHEVQLYAVHLQAPPEESLTDEDSRRVALRRLWGLPEEVLKSPDPLAALLKRHEVPAAPELVH